jgi:hypothetical protein
MTKLKLTKKAKTGILVAIASILIIALIIILLNIEKPKVYDLTKLEPLIINEFPTLYLTEMDHIDVLNEFGFEKSEVSEALFLKSLQLDDNGNDITESQNFVIIMNTENYEFYRDIFESHVDSNLRYTEDDNTYKLYEKSIVKSGANYVYAIISLKSQEIEKLINE